jgi:hypothetical protein
VKLRRIFFAYCILLVLLTMGLISCTNGGPGGYNATATYGAEMYHAQQTAIAGGQP